MTVNELSTAPPLLADRTLLRQALLNLLSHALDVLPAGTRLTIESTEQAGSLQILLRQTSRPQPMEEPSASPTPLREGVALTVAQSLIGAQNGRLTLYGIPEF
jgi:signal transduction histidine kinase